MVNKNWKWIHLTCPLCGKEVMPSLGPLSKPDAMVSVYPCWECEHPDLVEAERLKWEEADRKIAEMYARGEIKDANGNVIGEKQSE